MQTSNRQLLTDGQIQRKLIAFLLVFSIIVRAVAGRAIAAIRLRLVFYRTAPNFTLMFA